MNYKRISLRKSFLPLHDENFIDLLYVLHKEPRKKRETHAKLSLQHSGNIDATHVSSNQSNPSYPEVHFCNVSTSKSISDIFEQPNISNFSNFIVLLEGAPGMGKTTVAKQIAYQWAQKNILLNIKLLLLIHLRDPGVQACEGFEELMQYCYPGDKVMSSNCAQYFINKTQGDDLMIIFDGYDEISTETMIHSFVMELLNKNSSRSILPSSSIIITSRPHSISHLYQFCDCRVEIMGLTEDDRDNYLKNTFKLCPEKYIYTKEYLENHLTINSICYTPLNMTIFMHLVRLEERLPETQTELIMKFINIIINQNRLKKNEKRIDSLEDPSIKDIMFYLAKFAYRMIEKGHLVFTKEEINKANIKMDKDCNAFGLLQCVQFFNTINKPQKCLYSFSHFSFQEYLAAYYLTKSCYITQICTIYNIFWKAKYFGIWRMYTGITGGEAIPLKMFLSGEGIISAGIRYICDNKFPGISKEYENNKVMRLQLYLIFLEAPKSQIAKTLSSFFDKQNIDLHGENLKLQNMEILGNFIARSFISKSWGYVNLSDCSINDKNCMVFYEQLTLQDGRTKPLIAKLNLSGNKICELSTVFSLAAEYKISRLLVSRNSFQNCKNFKSHLHCNHTTLKFLDMSSNNLQNQHLEYMCEALSNHNNLEELIINDNKINDQGLKPLIKLLIQLELLQTISCEDNSFSDYQYVDKLLKFTIEYLNFRKTSVSFRDNQVCYFIIILGCIKDISANRSNFVANTEQVSSLSLTSGDDHILEQNMYEKYSSLAEAFCFIKRMIFLTELNLSGVKINNRAGDVLSDILASHLQLLEMLRLNNCGITSEIAIKIGEAIQVCSAIKELQLCHNQIDDEAMIVFVKSLFDLKLIIKLENNNFSDQGKFFLNLLKNNIQNDAIDFSNNYYIVKAFLNLLDHASNDFSITAMKFVDNAVQTKYLLLGVVKEHYALQKQLKMTVNASFFFQNFCNLLQLNLSGVIITEQTAVELFSDLNSVLALEYVIMNNCKLTSEITINFVSQLQSAKLRELQLCNNMIDNKATQTLIHATFKWNFLKVFKVTNNHFSNGDARLLKEIGKLVQLPNDVFNVNVYPPLIPYMEEVPKADSMLLTKIFEISNLQVKTFRTNPCLNSDVPLLSHKNCFYMNHDFCIFFYTNFFQRFVNLTDLHITKVFIAKEVGDNLCIALRDKLQCSLHYLRISNCIFTASFCFKLLNQINDTSVEKFKLCRNNILVNYFEIDLFDEMFQTIAEMVVLRGFNINLPVHIHIIIICMLLLIISIKDKMTIKFIKNVYQDAHLCSYGEYDEMMAYYIHKPKVNTNVYQGVYVLKDMTTKYVLKTNHLTQLTFDASNILYVDLSGILIDEHIAGSLASVCSDNLRFLQVLRMNNCSLSTKIILDILPKLQIATNMKEFQLCNNNITNEATKLFILSIFSWKCLKILKLDDNKFTYDPNELFLFVIKSSRSYSFRDSILGDLNTTRLASLITLLEYMRTFSSDSSFAECASLFYKQLNSITKLNFSGISIDEETAHKFVYSFDSILQYLQQLIMNNCKLYSKILISILSKLHVAVNMKELQICDNYIDDEAVSFIIVAMFQWNSFKTLEYRNNNFKENSQKILNFILRLLNGSNSTITDSEDVKLIFAQLSYNNCTSKSASLLFQRLAGLITLDLSYIQLTLGNSDIITNALAVDLSSLQALNLDSCNLGSLPSINVIKALNKATLKELSVSNNEIGDNVAYAIKDFVKNNNVLTEIYLSHNNLGTVGTLTITDGLASCQNLRILDLSYNNITDECTKSLCYLMKRLYQYGNLLSINVRNDKLSQQSLNNIYYAAGWAIWLKFLYTQHLSNL